MATLLAHITVKPGSEERFEGIARELYERTHALETGVLRYEYWRGNDPRTYYTLLSFDDHRAFIVHQTSDHHEVASPSIGEMVESLRLEWLDPHRRRQPAPADRCADPRRRGANELTITYTDRFAADVADWWLTQR